MSVVNDVLNDLHKRRSEQQNIQAMPLFDNGHKPPRINITSHVLTALIVLVFTSIVFYFFLINTYNSNSIFHDKSSAFSQDTETYKSQLPSDTIVVDKTNTVSLKNRPDINKTIDKKSINTVALSTLDIIETEAVINQEVIEQKPQQKIKSSVVFTKETSESIPQVITSNIAKTIRPAVSNINADSKIVNMKNPVDKPLVKSDSRHVNAQKNKSKSVINNISKNDEILKSLMTNSPDQVWDYIQTILPSADNKIHLMAIGAQGEQRSNRHEAALAIYRTLIDIQPKESKWRVGSAISLDALSEHNKALQDYRQSLVFNSLPPALNTFVRQRIAQLSEYHYE